MTRNGERLENHVLCNATIFGIEQFPSERIYITSTQKCSYCILLKKKTTMPGFQMTRHSFHPFSGLLSIDLVAFYKISIHVAITRTFRIATSICSNLINLIKTELVRSTLRTVVV